MRLIRRILGVVAIFFVVIVPHELGHLLSAKAAGVGVARFSLGFGPILLSHQDHETQWAVSAIPLGGYVMLVDEGILGWWSREELVELAKTRPDAWRMLHDRSRRISYKPPAVRFFVASSGSLVNFLFALWSMPALFRMAKDGTLSLEAFDLLEDQQRRFLGPIALVKMAGRSVDRGLPAAWALAVRFSIGIGMLQLLPIPFLDGQHLAAALLMSVFSFDFLSIALIAAFVWVILMTYGRAVNSMRELRAVLALPRSSSWSAMAAMLLQLFRERNRQE